MEGPECDLFDSVPVITLSNDSVRAGRPNQKKSRNYRNFGWWKYKFRQWKWSINTAFSLCEYI